jgi:hypothetical protein
VPLAGPDFERDDGSVKAELLIDGEPLLSRTIHRRPWWRKGQAKSEDLVFVLRDTQRVRRFVQESLLVWFPGAATVFISKGTQGAAITVLAGLSLVIHHDGALCVDLVDIEYETEFDPLACFAANPDAGAAALIFQSDRPIYSYLRTDETGCVVEAAEKRVISSNASAGTYFFASPHDYLLALAHNVAHAAEVTFKSLFFVCPLYNGVLASGRSVIMEPVSNIVDIKLD